MIARFLLFKFNEFPLVNSKISTQVSSFDWMRQALQRLHRRLRAVHGLPSHGNDLLLQHSLLQLAFGEVALESGRRRRSLQRLLVRISYVSLSSVEKVEK